jgi:hypothetical protein
MSYVLGTEALCFHLRPILVVLRRGAGAVAVLLLASLLGCRTEPLGLNLWPRAESTVLATLAFFVADVHDCPFR